MNSFITVFTFLKKGQAMGVGRVPGKEEPAPALIFLSPHTWLISLIFWHPSKYLVKPQVASAPWLRISALEPDLVIASSYSSPGSQKIPLCYTGVS